MKDENRVRKLWVFCVWYRFPWGPLDLTFLVCRLCPRDIATCACVLGQQPRDWEGIFLCCFFLELKHGDPAQST